MPLYRVDLSAIFDKYIGETEKHLDRLFDAAAEASAVLLFDEADALFGKRTAWKDAHDRYANLSVAYLLQRIETYDGLAILATNLPGNMDQAFARRLAHVIAFPLPDEAERRALWARAFRRKRRSPPTSASTPSPRRSRYRAATSATPRSPPPISPPATAVSSNSRPRAEGAGARARKRSAGRRSRRTMARSAPAASRHGAPIPQPLAKPALRWPARHKPTATAAGNDS